MTHTSPSRGFTLIELVVSMGIFFIFITVLIGVFGVFMAVQRHSIAQGALILEVQSVIESFIKEARTGYGSTYEVVKNGNAVMFRNQSGICVLYQTRDGIIERAETRGTQGSNCNEGQFNDRRLFVPLSSTSMNISKIFFDVSPGLRKSSPDQEKLERQGMITISLTAETKTGDILPITVQNTVTSRQIQAYDTNP